MKLRKYLSGVSILAILATGVITSAPIQAAENAEAATSGGLEEVVVTAQKREQDLQKVGISVTAVSGEQILERGISNGIDLITRAPSVDNYSPYGPGSSANIVIRGVGLNDFGEGNEAPITTYVDEFYIVNVPAVDLALFDLDRVEILRGPQGTLFGRNSTGGLIHYVTKKPTNDLSGYAKVSYASYNELKIEGAVNVPISNVLSGRLSFFSHHSDGYIRNLNPLYSDQKGAAAGTDAVRGQLRFNNGDWDVLLKVEYGRQNHVHTYYEQAPTTRNPVTGLGSVNPGGTDGAGYNEANFGAAAPNVAYTNAPQRLSSNGTTVLLHAEKQFGDIDFTSITGYQHFQRELREDCDASPNNSCAATFPYKGDTATQELRLYSGKGSFRWTTGVFGLYNNAKNNPSAIFNIPVSGPTAVDPVTGLYDGAVFPINLAANWKQRTKSLSIYGQGEVDLTSNVTLLAGVRVTNDNKHFNDYDNASLRTCPGFPIPTNCFLAPEGPGIANPYYGSYNKTLISGKVELDYKPTNEVLLFGSVSRGTKAGGFNNGFYPGGISTSQIPYGDERMIAYEAGEKITFFDHRLRLNTSIFYYDYSRFQTFDWEGIGGLLGIHKGRSYGGEVELEAAPVDNLNIRFGGSFLKTKIYGVTNGVPDGSTYTADREMANAPKWTANGAIDYTIPLEGGRSIALNWDWNYRSSRYTNNFNDPSVKLDGYFKHNADIAFNLNEHLQLQGFVRNISNKIPITKAFQFNDLGYVQYIYSEPRVFGGGVLVRW